MTDFWALRLTANWVSSAADIAFLGRKAGVVGCSGINFPLSYEICDSYPVESKVQQQKRTSPLVAYLKPGFGTHSAVDDDMISNKTVFETGQKFPVARLHSALSYCTAAMKHPGPILMLFSFLVVVPHIVSHQVFPESELRYHHRASEY